MFGIRHTLRLASRKYYFWRLRGDLKRRLSLEQLRSLKLSPNEQYLYCVYYFDHFLPKSMRAHRRYFVEGNRGFGEDAFHAMWFLLFEHFRPKNALEIGVYRGQTITLWKLLARHFQFDGQVAAISPFTSAGDAVSNYAERLDYFEDTVLNHKHFELSLPEFYRGFSTAPEAKSFIASRQWDIIYIDGNHDYQVALQDWTECAKAIKPGGIIVLDDSALDTNFSPPAFATAGHPGPSRIASEIDRSQFQEILSVGHNRVFQRLT
jgi:predicted O-methyltransferase YrrM